MRDCSPVGRGIALGCAFTVVVASPLGTVIVGVVAVVGTRLGLHGVTRGRIAAVRALGRIGNAGRRLRAGLAALRRVRLGRHRGGLRDGGTREAQQAGEYGGSDKTWLHGDVLRLG